MEQLKRYWKQVLLGEEEHEWWDRKKYLYKQRNIEVIRVYANAHIYQHRRFRFMSSYRYHVHFSILIKQKERMYMEEEIVPFQFHLKNGMIYEHEKMEQNSSDAMYIKRRFVKPERFKRNRLTYNRLEAVKYAEVWWNDYNPAFRKFSVDCTNFVSQCLLAGGAPMRGEPNREDGWWYEEMNWSFSWAVAHSLRWYLSGSESGLRGIEVAEASELHPGDVICYDFEGDGRFDHQTIVVAKDEDNMPLVNAHTDNSRHRYWSYEDSAAWTADIKYKFYSIEFKPIE